MVWVVGGKEGENSQGALRAVEVKRVDQASLPPAPWGSQGSPLL